MKNLVKVLIIFAILVGISVIIINIFNKIDDKLVVCIDAGHGGTDVGAFVDNRYEKNDVLKVAKLVKKYLEEQEINVVMTRDSDVTVSLQERCKIANRKKADLFVAIHRNSAEEGNGIEIWTSSDKNNEDMELATNILNNLSKLKIQSNRGVKYGSVQGENTDYYVLKYTKMPSCLIELGFITNEKDNKLFDENIENYAKAISSGIVEKMKGQQYE